MDETPGRLLMGRISGVHGVNGWLKLHSYARPLDAIFDYQPWTLSLRGVESRLKVVEWRVQGRGLLFRSPNVDDRNTAEALIGAEIWVDRSALPAAAPGEYYWADLEGLQVVTVDGIDLGRVDHLVATGANDVLVVQGERQRLVPFVTGRYVMSVDIPAGRIVVDWDPEF
jgi:16S rRNA processing protein RimM